MAPVAPASLPGPHVPAPAPAVPPVHGAARRMHSVAASPRPGPFSNNSDSSSSKRLPAPTRRQAPSPCGNAASGPRLRLGRGRREPACPQTHTCCCGQMGTGDSEAQGPDGASAHTAPRRAEPGLQNRPAGLSPLRQGGQGTQHSLAQLSWAWGGGGGEQGGAPTCAAAPVPPALPAQHQGEGHQQQDEQAGQRHHQQEPPLLVERGVRLRCGQTGTCEQVQASHGRQRELLRGSQGSP